LKKEYKSDTDIDMNVKCIFKSYKYIKLTTSCKCCTIISHSL